MRWFEARLRVKSKARPPQASRYHLGQEMSNSAVSGSASNVFVNREAQRGQRVREQRANRRLGARSWLTGGEHGRGAVSEARRNLLGFNRLDARFRRPDGNRKRAGILADTGSHIAVAPRKQLSS